MKLALFKVVKIMSLTPISREHLRSLKTQKDEENRLEQLNQNVRNLYNSVMSKAQTSTETFYHYAQISDFHRKNMPDILSSLKTLFPDCAIEYVNLFRGQDGKMYDINKMDEKVLQIIFHPSYQKQAKEHIVIDWS